MRYQIFIKPSKDSAWKHLGTFARGGNKKTMMSSGVETYFPHGSNRVSKLLQQINRMERNKRKEQEFTLGDSTRYFKISV